MEPVESGGFMGPLTEFPNIFKKITKEVIVETNEELTLKILKNGGSSFRIIAVK